MTRTAFERRAPDAYWVQNDTAPALAEQLFDGNGDPVNLAGASVKFLGQIAGETLINAAATITDAATGKVSFTPSSSHTSKIGAMMVHWQVTFSGGVIETFAGSHYQKILVTKDLGS